MSSRIVNTLALPCVAHRLFEVSGIEDVRPAIDWSQASGLPLCALGAGSNVVLPPELAAGVVKVCDESVSVLSETTDTVTLRVGAGKGWHSLVSETLQSGFYGFENLALIPGLVGAAPVQNIGAYGRELNEFVVAVHGVSLHSGEPRSLSAEECKFAYRDSIFKHELRDQFLITHVDLCLGKVPVVNVDYPALRSSLGDGERSPLAVFEAVVALRRKRLPNPDESPNAGSFFKNPILSAEQLEELQSIEPEVPVYSVANEQFKVPAAWLIERAGLRGFSMGPASISEQHALVLVTDGKAYQADVRELAKHVQKVVIERFTVMLEPEPRFYD
ncbi:UDP-N-acetylmuramate dehydrogenase [Congregibacter brevis]|uniref:UDP-N-acetylenolpyruvoylglucosamine reductase n=1 Tax=Congregibacter brevis TaxID=3081201 RepID=A0ABZ0IB20_9GAMM|nr:UDP-N-acetylmuramate dehydrogenase [Congregibacter sp. IMCC45268]